MSKKKKKNVLDVDSDLYTILCQVADYKAKIGDNPAELEKKKLSDIKMLALFAYGMTKAFHRGGKLQMTDAFKQKLKEALGRNDEQKEEKPNE